MRTTRRLTTALFGAFIGVSALAGDVGAPVPAVNRVEVVVLVEAPALTFTRSEAISPQAVAAVDALKQCDAATSCAAEKTLAAAEGNCPEALAAQSDAEVDAFFALAAGIDSSTCPYANHVGNAELYEPGQVVFASAQSEATAEVKPGCKDEAACCDKANVAKNEPCTEAANLAAVDVVPAVVADESETIVAAALPEEAPLISVAALGNEGVVVPLVIAEEEAVYTASEPVTLAAALPQPDTAVTEQLATSPQSLPETVTLVEQPQELAAPVVESPAPVTVAPDTLASSAEVPAEPVATQDFAAVQPAQPAVATFGEIQPAVDSQHAAENALTVEQARLEAERLVGVIQQLKQEAEQLCNEIKNLRAEAGQSKSAAAQTPNIVENDMLSQAAYSAGPDYFYTNALL
jgi:hypothetical protein